MKSSLLLLACLILARLMITPVGATPALGVWEPLFKGIDHAVGTNTPGGGMPNQHVVHAIRVDLTDPDIRLFSSPRLENYALGSSETGGYTVSGFLSRNHLQLAVNAALFSPQEYYLPAGTPMDMAGFSVSEGVVVSAQDSRSDAATLTFTTNNVPTIIPTNWPPVSANGIYTAVSGSYPILVGGVNFGPRYVNDSDFIHHTNPRTIYGISKDQRHLFIVTIDGRQPGYSDGANDYESAAWLLLLGSWDGINMDGGGSTTLVIEDSLGKPLRLNRSSAVADSGRERTVGSHFGVYAKPAVAFVNDVAATPDDISALVTWTTTAPATSLVRYGTTADLGSSSPLVSDNATRHSILIPGLALGTTYYYSAVSANASGEYASPVHAFVTSNFVSTASVFDVTQPWKYNTANLDGVSWTASGYDDSAWAGPDPGLLWADSRGSVRAGVEPANTRMTLHPSSGYPYPTYYFRTHFTFSGSTAGASMIFTNFVDDGLVLYLNGRELYRLHMEAAPAPITYTDIAQSYGCDGDATCSDIVTITGTSLVGLVSGDNVLAAEVHNYNARSPDITFGLGLACTLPLAIQPALQVRAGPGTVTLDWTRPGFVVQEAVDATGPWKDTAGPVTASPFTTQAGGTAKFFRLRPL